MPPAGRRQAPPDRNQASGRPGAGGPSSGPGRGAPQPGAQRPPRGPGERPVVAAAAFPDAGADQPEPELITHRSYNGTGDTGFDDDGYDPVNRSADGYDRSADGYDVENQAQEPGIGALDDDPGPKKGRKSKKPLTPAQRRKRRWKIFRRSLYAIIGIFFVIPAAAFAITYFLVDVPSPEDVAADQAKVVTYLYSDGETEMGRDIPPDGGNRILLKPHEITPVVKHAVYAAEDATFETNPGFDITGILRAVYNQFTGGVGGGSTITQQYIKVATDSDDYSLERKWTEIVKAFKMNNEQSKEEVVTAYLNTIFFGRSSYGIQTAAQSYFGKDAKDLNASEAALLAGMIQQPGRSEDPEVRAKRWSYVMDQMVANGWLPKEERDQAKLPELVPVDEAKPETITGPERFVQQRVNAELAEKGYPEEKLRSGGYKVHLTIDKQAQEQAEQAVNQVMEGEPADLKEALVAVDPKTGGVQAYYGGPWDAEVPGGQYDWAAAQRNPGSSYKPFDLVALLQQDRGLGEVYDGSSPRTFGDREVRNSEDAQCPECTVAEAMKRSINTVFFDMVVNELGPRAVVDAALQAGIPEKGSGVDGRETMPTLDGNISIGGGDTMVSPLHMAAAYATFADQGMRHEPHFVAKLTTPDGEVVFDETSEVATEGEPAFADDPERSKQIAGNVTESLIPVLEESELVCADGRSCAGKTGTHQYVDPSGATSNENSEAWMVGYTPQISASVWIGTGENKPIRNAADGRVYGSGLPGEIWKTFMDLYLQDKPRAEFPEVEPIGRTLPPPPPPTSEVVETPEESPTESEPTSTEPSITTPSTPPSDDPELPELPDPTDDEEDPGGPGDGWPPWENNENDAIRENEQDQR